MQRRTAYLLRVGWGDFEETLLRGDRLDVHSPSGPIEPHLPVDERENRIVAPRPTFLPGRNFVPRWRIMMLPATTTSLPNFSRPAVC